MLVSCRNLFAVGSPRSTSESCGARRPESIRGAKEWLSRHMERGRCYSEPVDQPKFAARFDLEAARALPSFSKFCRDVRGLVEQVRLRFSS